jgi:small subunit ribosomal protein S17
MANKNEEITETEATETAAVEETTPAPETVEAAPAEETAEAKTAAPEEEKTAAASAGEATARKGERGNRAQKVGTVSSDKMEKTVVVRVDRLVKHPTYRRYVRRRTKFMAHNEMGAATGDRVRIVETRPLSARKRWRVVEIIQKAEK